MLSKEDGEKPVTGFCVYDTVLIMHIIEKLLRSGVIVGKELPHLSSLRIRAVKAAMDSGFDIEALCDPNIKSENAVQGG